MGDHSVSTFEDAKKRQEFTKNLLDDLKALELLIKNNKFETETLRIGAEQELGLVGSDWYPAMNYDKILHEVNDPHFTTELGRFNLEINLDPYEFKGECFSKMQKQLDELLNKVKNAANKFDTNIILTGILPTINSGHLQFKNMTPNPRYKALNDLIKGRKSQGFEVNIQGIDELKTHHPNILFEACNTSFQVHYQLTPGRFVAAYNWALAIAGPVLSISANSPLLGGKRLWAETRIALFQQSIDMRNSSNLKRDLEPRVTFGKDWVKESVTELYQDNITRFDPFFAPDSLENSMVMLEQQKTPKLRALCMHSGTVYMWNRVCYGISENNQPHLRIENRYLPAGPTSIDEVANAAFWLGLMEGMPEEYNEIAAMMEFEDARFNFYNAARTGLETNLKWMGESIHAKDFILNKCLKWAKNGLHKRNVATKDIDTYLSIIEQRANSGLTGARWSVENFNSFRANATPFEANVNLTRSMYNQEATGKPVHQWPFLKDEPKHRHNHFHIVEQIMSTDIPTVHEDDILDLVIHMMVWRNVRYIAVENSKHELVGLIASRMLTKLIQEGWKNDIIVKDIMVTDVVTVSPQTTTAEAVKIMAEKNIGCLPVLTNKKLAGMISEREIVHVVHVSGKFNN